MIYKFSNNEISVGTANTVYDSRVIRLVNTTTGIANVTVSVNSSVNAYSFTILANSEMLIEKSNTHRVQGTGIVASPAGFKY